MKQFMKRYMVGLLFITGLVTLSLSILHRISDSRKFMGYNVQETRAFNEGVAVGKSQRRNRA